MNRKIKVTKLDKKPDTRCMKEIEAYGIMHKLFNFHFPDIANYYDVEDTIEQHTSHDGIIEDNLINFEEIQDKMSVPFEGGEYAIFRIYITDEDVIILETSKIINEYEYAYHLDDKNGDTYFSLDEF